VQQSTFERLCEPCAVQPSQIQPRKLVSIAVGGEPPSAHVATISQDDL